MSYWPDDCIPDPKLRRDKPGRPRRAIRQKGPAPAFHRPPDEPVDPQFFEWLKAAALPEARFCARSECRQRQRCCGGPRGIARLRGIPACKPGRAGEEWARGEVAGILELRGKWRR